MFDRMHGDDRIEGPWGQLNRADHSNGNVSARLFTGNRGGTSIRFDAGDLPPESVHVPQV
jgi:hypothetical protein